MLQSILDKQNILLPGPSSQTSSIWPLVLREENEQIMGHSVGHFAGSPIILPFKEQSWDEIMEEILSEYAEAWKTLAAL